MNPLGFLTMAHGRSTALGLVYDDHVVNVTALRHALGAAAPTHWPVSLRDMIHRSREVIGLVDEIIVASQGFDVTVRSRDTYRLALPFRPSRLYCVASNYRRDDRRPRENARVYIKPSETVIGPEDAIRLNRDLTLEPDYEGEFAVVIGAQCGAVTADQARDVVFGYTCVNDVTARDAARRPRKWLTAKNLDTFTPLGPIVAHRDSFQWPPRLGLRTLLNGDVRQSANTGDLEIEIPDLIAQISREHGLRPGDVIATGTPPGLGIDQTPPAFLRSGDQVEVEIDGIGRLSNRCL